MDGKLYRVKISFDVTEMNGAEFHNTELSYGNMTIDHVTAVEGLGIQLVNGLGKLGIDGLAVK